MLSIYRLPFEYPGNKIDLAPSRPPAPKSNLVTAVCIGQACIEHVRSQLGSLSLHGHIRTGASLLGQVSKQSNKAPRLKLQLL